MNIQQSASCCNDFLRVAKKNFTSIKNYADKTLEQLEENDIHISYGGETNTIAVIIQHITGNLNSRFTDFFSSDGEKPDRNRDAEFVDARLSKKDLMEKWNSAWIILYSLLDGLKGEDLMRTVYIRGEAHTALEAISRQVWHYSFHAGQIVALAKQIKGESWKNLSISKKK